MPPKRRSPGEGSFYQIADGSWRYALTVQLPDGRVERRDVRVCADRDGRFHIR